MCFRLEVDKRHLGYQQMSRFQSAYDTTACVGYTTSTMKTIHEALKASFIKGDISLHADSGSLLVTGLLNTRDIPTFTHPITLEVEGVKKTFIDVRSCVKLEQHSNDYLVKDQDEFEFLTMRCHLDHLWNTEMPSLLQNVSKLPIAVYANLIGEYTARRLALDPRDTLTVTVLAAVLYLNLFTDDTEVRKTDATHMAQYISNALSMRAPTVYDIIENNTVINNLEDFCETCKEFSQSVRLRDLNPVTLFGMVGPAWYGNNGRELMAVAMEHPPTWLALLKRAMTSRGYNNTGLSKFMERGIFRKLGEGYPRQLAQLLHKPY